MEENKYLYMVSLNRFRIFAVCSVVFTFFAIFFFVGLAVGIRSNSEVEASSFAGNGFEHNSRIVKLPNPYDKSARSYESQGSKVSSLNSDQNRSSYALLKEDNPEAVSGVPEIKTLPAAKTVRSQAVSSSKTYSSQKKTAPKTYSKKKYYLQIMVTSDGAKAKKILNDLLIRKYKGYLRSRKERGRTLYYVRVGLYGDYKKAQSDLRILKAKGGFKDAFLVINQSTGSKSTGRA